VCKRSRSDGDDNSMTIGTVKWFNAEKGILGGEQQVD
jgi:hypothetical protein